MTSGGWIAAGALALLMGACAEADRPTQGAEDMEQLKALILKVDPTAILRAQTLGRSAGPALRELAKNPDDAVRVLALQCLAAAAPPDAGAAFAAALTDSNEQVTSVAGGALLAAPPDPKLLPALMEAIDKASYGSARGLAARVIGRFDAGADVEGLRKRWEKELDPSAKEGETMGLSRLGVKEAREDFLVRLQASTGWRRRDYLEVHVRYVGQPWILKPLIGVLDDTTKLINLNVDGLDEPPKDVRACDLAVTRVIQISGRKFTFKAEDYKIYTPQEIDEVRRYLKTLP